MSLNNTQAGAVPETAVPRYPAGGAGKFLSDSVSVFEINFFSAERHWYLLLLMSAGIPLPWFFVTRAIAPDDPGAIRRLLAGTLLFGVSFPIGMQVGQNAVSQRFMGNLKLFSQCLYPRARTSWARSLSRLSWGP